MPHAHLSPDTCLALAPGIRTRLDEVGHVLVDAPDGTIVDVGPRGFAILSIFARPLSLGAAIERLENADERAGGLERELGNASKVRAGLAAKLSGARAKAARQLDRRVGAELAELAMDGASLGRRRRWMSWAISRS